jgi:hypothetical protein
MSRSREPSAISQHATCNLQPATCVPHNPPIVSRSPLSIAHSLQCTYLRVDARRFVSIAGGSPITRPFIRRGRPSCQCWGIIKVAGGPRPPSPTLVSLLLALHPLRAEGSNITTPSYFTTPHGNNARSLLYYSTRRFLSTTSLHLILSFRPSETLRRIGAATASQPHRKP